jgi:hypothetical protein
LKLVTRSGIQQNHRFHAVIDLFSHSLPAPLDSDLFAAPSVCDGGSSTVYEGEPTKGAESAV